MTEECVPRQGLERKGGPKLSLYSFLPGRTKGLACRFFPNGLEVLYTNWRHVLDYCIVSWLMFFKEGFDIYLN